MSGPQWTCKHGQPVGDPCEDCQRLRLAIAATQINPHLLISSAEWSHYGFRRAS